MRSKSLWFSIGIALGSCLAFTPGQDHQVLREIRLDTPQEPFEQVTFAGDKARTGTIYEILSNDPRFVFKVVPNWSVEGSDRCV
jgi:hypothetical protein